MTSQTVKLVNSNSESLQRSVAYIGTEKSDHILKDLPSFFRVHKHQSLKELKKYLDNQSILSLPDIILMETDPAGDCFAFIEKIKKNPLWRELIIVLIATEKNKDWKARALQLKVHDYYIIPFPIEHLLERLDFLIKFKLIKPQLSVLEDANVVYRFPVSKKLFDILISGFAIVFLTPILLLTALIIKLDSKGPIIYKSKRVGTGYNIFNFYKFRSMYANADKQLEELTELNRYGSDEEDFEGKTAFVKLKDDPRITRFGSFIRSTSIDELPQLFNVLLGDMSLVGNRPLPLYEAEMLTSNEWSMRFMGPAGVTGLWQIKSRGKRDISSRERKKFDNFYALKYSFWFDVEILVKTLPVIFHKEKF
jgi:lipopolysaccharide/colanic/teichoic acid biosynthesis glycosyltransferase/CheY-like chemotaxis protein